MCEAGRGVSRTTVTLNLDDIAAMKMLLGAPCEGFAVAKAIREPGVRAMDDSEYIRPMRASKHALTSPKHHDRLTHRGSRCVGVDRRCLALVIAEFGGEASRDS